jgi:hypothetical protein
VSLSPLPPIPPDDFTFAVSPPEFADSVPATLGAFGTADDGRDALYAFPSTHARTVPDPIKAIRDCFAPHAKPWDVLRQPFEDDLQTELDTFLAGGDQVLADLAGLGA